MGILLLCILLLSENHNTKADTDCPLSNRWYRMFYTLNGANTYWAYTSDGLNAAKKLADTASAHGFTGVQVPIHYYIMDWDSTTKSNFKEFANYCNSINLDVIPEVFPINGAGFVFDRNFAEADQDTMILIAGSDSLLPLKTNNNYLQNAGFESFSADHFSEYLFQDKEGISTFADTNIRFEGKTSIRFENFSANDGMIRICQNIKVIPNHHYTCSFVVKQNNFNNDITFLVLGKDYDNYIQYYNVPYKSTDTNWVRYSFEFSTFESELRLYAGTWNGTNGKFHIDNIIVKESESFSNIVRSAGIPLSIKNIDGSITYTEGIDYDSIRNQKYLSAFHKIGANIKTSDTLILSCSKAADYAGYKSICMTNDNIYTYFTDMMKEIYSLYKYKKVFLYIDEIRTAASCPRCINTGKSTAQILGECTTRLYDSLKSIDPTIEVLTWGDMFDPNWNARNHYYKVVGDITGSDKFIPKDITIIPWGNPSTIGSSQYNFIKNSIDYFSENCFNIIGAGYYDTGNLTGTSSWIKLLFDYKQSKGLIYTTWDNNDYSLVPEFGDLMIDSINSRTTSISLISQTNTETQEIFTNTNIESIIYKIDGYADSAYVVGLPKGIIGSYKNNIFTISGFSADTGIYKYSVYTLRASCIQSTARGSIRIIAEASSVQNSQYLNNIILVSPNPTNGIINLFINDKESYIHSISINDVLGNEIYKDINNHKSPSSRQIDLQNYSNGIYFLLYHLSNNLIIQYKIYKY